MTPENKKLCDLGDYEFECKNYQNSYEYFKKSIELDPDEPYGWYKRSLAAAKLDNIDEFIAGFEKAMKLSKGTQLSEISGRFLWEKAILFGNMINYFYDAAKNAPHGVSREVNKIEYCQSCEKNVTRLIAVREELRADNAIGNIIDEHAVEPMREIYNLLVQIEGLRNAFGPVDMLWRRTVGRQIAPIIDNTAAWLNYKQSKQKYSYIASVFH